MIAKRSLSFARKAISFWKNPFIASAFCTQNSVGVNASVFKPLDLFLENEKLFKGVNFTEEKKKAAISVIDSITNSTEFSQVSFTLRLN